MQSVFNKLELELLRSSPLQLLSTPSFQFKQAPSNIFSVSAASPVCERYERSTNFLELEVNVPRTIGLLRDVCFLFPFKNQSFRKSSVRNQTNILGVADFIAPDVWTTTYISGS